MNKEKVSVKSEIIQDKMYYKKTMILSYKIEYPQFASAVFLPVVIRLNQYYMKKALAYQKYIREKLFHSAVEEYESAVANDFPVRAFDVVLTYKITYNQNCALSLYYENYEYTGGAHGMTTRYSDTWNLQTGARITLGELFPTSFNYKDYILKSVNAMIAEQIRKGNNIYFEDYEKNTLTYFDPDNFYLSLKGIVFYYQLYEIGPYVSGIIEFTIPYVRGVVEEPRCR